MFYFSTNKSVWSKFYLIFWKFIQLRKKHKYSESLFNWDKTQMLKKIPSDKINVTKNTHRSSQRRCSVKNGFLENFFKLCWIETPYFLEKFWKFLRTPILKNNRKNQCFWTHHSYFIRDCYTSGSTIFIFLKVYVRFSIFDSVSFYTLFKKSIDSLTLKVHNSFQNKNNRKVTYSLAPGPLTFKLQQEVWKFNDIYLSCSLQMF